MQGFIVVPNSDLVTLINELAIYKKLTLEESGCLVFTVEQYENDIQRFYVYEEFINQPAFDAHQARVRSPNWSEVTKNVERHYQISTAE